MLIRLSYPLDCKEWIELKWDALVSDKKRLHLGSLSFEIFETEKLVHHGFCNR